MEVRWRRGRNAILAGALAASLAAAGGAALAAGAAGQGSRPVVAAAMANGSASSRRVPAGSGAILAAGQMGPRSAVPWRRVGAGWVLAEYWPGQFAGEGKPKAAAATLYLVDPAGGRYRMYRWAVTASPPYLVDWSGDKTRALVSRAGWLEQVVLMTGKVTRFRLAGNAQVIGYTRPGGQGLLGWRQAGSRVQLARYRLTGHLAKVLAVGAQDYTAVYSPTGDMLAVAGTSGV